MSSSSLATSKSAADSRLRYNVLPTLAQFHQSVEPIRCIVGPVGSGKTTAAAIEVCWNVPRHLLKRYGIKHTRWVVVRNTYVELMDTTKRTIEAWFPGGAWSNNGKDMVMRTDHGFEVELLLRSCDRAEDIKKFKSLEVTGYWIDESIEVDPEIKRMLKTRIGRYPSKCPMRFGIETTNPPDVEDETYWQFHWQTPPPGPIATRDPLKGHAGFWQPPGENVANLRPGYYDDLRQDFAANPEWISMYIEGRPGIIVHGKLVYNKFDRAAHVAADTIEWTGGEITVGWDNSGNTPAAVALQIPSPLRCQVLREFYTDRMNIVDFTRYVLSELAQLYPGCKLAHFGDPAGETRFSTRDGGFTSNAALMRDMCGVEVTASDNNFQARVESVEMLLGMRDGMLIDPQCRRLINGFLGGYCYPPNKQIMGTYLPNVEKNKFSHVHDALQYPCVKLFGWPRREELRDRVKERLELADQEQQYDPLTWGDTPRQRRRRG